MGTNTAYVNFWLEITNQKENKTKGITLDNIVYTSKYHGWLLIYSFPNRKKLMDSSSTKRYKYKQNGKIAMQIVINISTLNFFFQFMDSRELEAIFKYRTED